MSKLGRYLVQQSKRICSEATREKTVSDKSLTDNVRGVPQRNNKVNDVRDEQGSLRRDCDCNAPTGVNGQTLAKGVRLLGKSTGSYGEPEIARGVH